MRRVTVAPDRASVRCARVLVYPTLVAGAATLSVAAFDRAVPAGVVIGLAQLATGGVIAALERVIPFERGWQSARDGDLRTDILHLLVSTLAVGGLVQALATEPLRDAAALLSTAIGRPVWPHEWPLAIQLVLALLISELGLYTVHRLEHTVPWLVRLHEVHHGVSRLYFLNVARNHPLDTVLTMAVGVFPLVVLGASERALVAYASLAAAHAFLQHANLDLRLGPLNRVLSLPEQHRFHHSSALAEARGNYGSILLVWDHVFGTALTPPTASRPARIGLVGSASSAVHSARLPPQWLAQIVYPFRRAQRDTSAPDREPSN